MIACVAIYILIGVTAVGALHFTEFANSPDPLALILRGINQPVVATILAVSAVVALPTVLLGFLFGQSSIFFTMARDGLLPAKLATVRSEEPTSELQSLMRSSYAVFCLKQKNNTSTNQTRTY